jgi:hypothetical protein
MKTNVVPMGVGGFGLSVGSVGVPSATDVAAQQQQPQQPLSAQPQPQLGGGPSPLSIMAAGPSAALFTRFTSHRLPYR